MTAPTKHFRLDGIDIPFRDGQGVLEAALDAGRYIPHLCFEPGLPAHDSCRLCTVMVGGGRAAAACSLPAAEGLDIVSNSPELGDARRQLLQLLFSEGNHICPGCERSGDCKLQASAYAAGMQDNHFPQLFPVRERDASHPEVMLDRDRCILCELCVRGSRLLDGKDVFAIARRGIASQLVVNSPSGLLGDSALAVTDHAVRLCPVGALLPKRPAALVPLGKRTYAAESIATVELRRHAARKTNEP